jgi:hypothetical protein
VNDDPTRFADLTGIGHIELDLDLRCRVFGHAQDKNKGGDPKVAPSETISLLASSLSQLFVVVLRLGRELHP